MRDHFVKALTEEAKRNRNIILVTGDLGFGVLDEFAKSFPKQYINAGVAEQNMTGLASGLGMDGKIAFTYSIGNFNTLRALEQIRNDACYHDANLNIVSIGGGFSYGALGYSHHATEDIAIMRALPNLRVFVPSDCWEVEQITKKVIELGGVNYIRIDKSFAENTHDIDSSKFEVGKARILFEGADLSIIVAGGIAENAIQAHRILKSEGINIRVVSMHTIKPLDRVMVIDCIKATGGIVTIEEHSIIGGLGSAVSELIMQEGIYPQKFKMLGLESKFSTIVGSQSYLRYVNGLDTESIVAKIKSLLK